MSSPQIEDLVVEILSHRFDDPRKAELGRVKSERINFSCPYCGDSYEKVDKKRGNIYLNSRTFKCFNDGCPKNFCSLSEFFSYWCQKYEIDITNINVDELQKEASTFNTDQALNTLRADVINNKLINTDKLIERFNLLDLKQAPKNSLVYNEAKSRCLFDVPNINTYVKIDSQLDKFIIINRDLKSDKIIGIYIRYLASSMRYKMIKYDQILNSLNIENTLSESEIDMVNYAGSYFNITNVDFNNRNIKAVEGQFDSLFLLNAIGISGVSKSMNLINYLNSFTNCYIIVDEDQGQLINKLLYQGHYVLLWGLLKHRIQTKFNLTVKDTVNISQGNLDVNDLYKLIKQYYSNLTVSKFNKLINNHISNQEIDTLLV